MKKLSLLLMPLFLMLGIAGRALLGVEPEAPVAEQSEGEGPMKSPKYPSDVADLIKELREMAAEKGQDPAKKAEIQAKMKMLNEKLREFYKNKKEGFLAAPPKHTVEMPK